MCNLYSNRTTPEELRRVFGATTDRVGNQPPLPAIFPRGEAPVVRATPEGREAVPMHWGFLMPARSKRTGAPILPKAINNARDDKLEASRFWSASFRERRCLVPATSFCEAKGRKPATYYWFGMDGEGDERPPFAMAGLWRRFEGRYRDDEPVSLDTYTVVTTTPNELVRPIHPDRMVVILAQDDWETWLHGSPEAARALCRPFPAERMRIVRSGEGERSDPAA